MASKSVRVRGLVEETPARLASRCHDVLGHGIRVLVDHGVDDVLLVHPTVRDNAYLERVLGR